MATNNDTSGCKYKLILTNVPSTFQRRQFARVLERLQEEYQPGITLEDSGLIVSVGRRYDTRTFSIAVEIVFTSRNAAVWYGEKIEGMRVRTDTSLPGASMTGSNVLGTRVEELQEGESQNRGGNEGPQEEGKEEEPGRKSFEREEGIFDLEL